LSRNIDIAHPEFRGRLRSLREAAELTKAELAARAGIAYRTVHDIETGRRSRAQEKTLRLLAKALGVSFDRLVHGALPPPHDPPSQPVATPRPRRNGRRSTMVTATVVVFVLTALGFAVNQWMAGPSVIDDAVSVAVTCFENQDNRDDPRHLGTIVHDLVINGLSESRYVRVISPPARGSHDRDAETEAAARSGARWVLRGSIIQEEPRLVIASRLEDIGDGTVMATQQVTAAEGETVFDAAARLAAEVKRDLVLPRGEATERGLPIARVTTRSVRAYRHYVEGVEYLDKLYRAEARAELRRAVAHDSTFAMAMVMLVHPEIAGPRSERDSLIAVARRNSAGLTPRERYYLDAFGAYSEGDLDGAVAACEALVREYPQEASGYRLLGRFYRSKHDMVKALSAYETAVQVDPFDGMSLNRLAYMRASLGEYDEALRCVEEYIRIAPAEANPYDTRGDMLAWTGHPEQAIASYKQALERNPAFFPSMQNLGVVLTLLRRYDEADGYFRAMLGSEDAGARSRGRWFLAMMEVYRGRLDNAEESLRRAMAADHLEQTRSPEFANKLCALARIQCERGNHESAAATYREALATVESYHPERMQLWPAGYVDLLSRFDMGAAEAYIDSLEVRRRTLDEENTRVYWASLGWIQLRRGEAEAACTSYRKALEERDMFDLRYPLGLAYLEAGRCDDAIATFESCLRSYSTSRLQHAIWGVKTYYHLARAYEAAGRINDAQRVYAEFLDIWGDTALACEEVSDASNRIATLDTNP
jgi:tetratricopeptide (TPR) repeat protein/TolB-like protein/DNA-binding XRE family transcriptional regulator